jgi:hypothetical protein
MLIPSCPPSDCVLRLEDFCGGFADDDVGGQVLPVVTRGMTDPSAMRRFCIPYNFSVPSTTDMACRPILAVRVWRQQLMAASRTKRLSSTPLRFACHDFRLYERRERGGIADLAAQCPLLQNGGSAAVPVSSGGVMAFRMIRMSLVDQVS